MKKTVAILLLILTFSLCFIGCEPQQSNGSDTEADSETKAELTLEDTDYRADCIKRKGKRLVIVLPESNKILPVSNSYVKHLSRVNDEKVLAAEKKITDSVKAIGEEPDWTLTLNEDGELCLKVEIIKFIDDAEGEGCGIDHEHIVFEESIVADE